jgi:acyl-CoA synthetase (AMP-forming)/AMP-acid ligase II
MSFGYCHATQLVAQIDTAGTLALLRGLFTPRTFGAAVAACAATTTTLVPSMLTMLARSGSPFFGDLASLRTIVFGGAPVEQEVLAALRRGLPQVELIQTYGQTEAGPRIATLREADAAIRPGSVGRPVPGVQVAIRTPAGQDLPARETGEIVVRGAGIMTGYYGDPAATAEVLAGGWLRTGDLGHRDQDGFLWLSGRLRNLIITAGRNVTAEEVEQHLREMPEILDAAVFGEPDELRGESIHALVVPRAVPPESRAVRAFLGSRLEQHKIPRRISIVDALPVTANGKLDRTRLSSLAART